MDELSTLAPLRQCCVIRKNTLKKLLVFKNSDRPLSEAVKNSLRLDTVAARQVPEKHLLALDRRLDVILSTVQDCVRRNGFQEVVRGT